MKSTCEDFFATRLPIAGLAACAARLPDGMILPHCYNRWLTPEQVRQATAHLTLAAQSLQQYQITPVRMGWIFEHLRVYLRLRPDNACLTLFMENRAEFPAVEVESVLDEFAGLSTIVRT
jgi:hypothetical protein